MKESNLLLPLAALTTESEEAESVEGIEEEIAPRKKAKKQVDVEMDDAEEPAGQDGADGADGANGADRADGADGADEVEDDDDGEDEGEVELVGHISVMKISSNRRG